jgi:hypothetical protein
MNRTSLGIAALALLVIGGLVLTQAPRPLDQNAVGFAGGCIRVGIVLGALWLALPQLLRFLAKTPKWLLVAGTIGIVVCAVKPLLLLVAVPMLVLLWFLGSKLRTKADKTIVVQPQAQARPRRRSKSR